MKSERWVETPKFMLRRDCLEYVTHAWPVGRFLEIGAGTGRLTSYFLERGFTGVCYDLGPETRRLLRQSLAPFEASIAVIDRLGDVEPSSFDYVFAFEVLEHIESDAEELHSWTSFLKPGGRILISVPAHMRKYGYEDRAVGHFRRYEKKQLARMLETAGCRDVRVVSYGFPIAILTRRGSQLLSAFKKKGVSGRLPPTLETLSIQSGIERSDDSLRLSRIFNHQTMAPFIALQRIFFEGDLGDGYVAHAVRAKPSAAVATG